MRYLLVGDMHVRKDNLEESKKLILWIKQVADGYSAVPVFLGDQHDGMAAIRAEIVEFWDWSYNLLGHSYTLTGNHDLSSDGTASAMTAHKYITNVIASDPEVLDSSLAAIGYIRDNDQFTQVVMKAYNSGARHILCHAEFDGAQYENNFYAPNGIDLSKFPEDLEFISGHIHKKQMIYNRNGKMKVLYAGTPRMLTRSDIGETKGLVVLDTANFDTFEFIPTPNDVAEPFQSYTVTENAPIPTIPNSSKVFVDILGSAEFIKKTYSKMPDLAKVRSIPKEETSQVNIKESEGVPAAFVKYMEAYSKEKSLPKQTTDHVVSDLLNRCPALKGNSSAQP